MVIRIVAVPVPALAGAKNLSPTTVGASNLRQPGTASITYADAPTVTATPTSVDPALDDVEVFGDERVLALLIPIVGRPGPQPAVIRSVVAVAIAATTRRWHGIA